MHRFLNFSFSLIIIFLLGCGNSGREDAINSQNTYSLTMQEGNQVFFELSPEYLLSTVIEEEKVEHSGYQIGSSDPDVKITTSSTNGEVYIDQYLVRYRPNPGYIGNDKFTIETGTEEYMDINIYNIEINIQYNEHTAQELPEISGYATTQIKTNTKYSFIPTLSETKSNVTFSITNKPSWLTFDSTNGLLTGISPENSFTYKDITIHISNGTNTTSLDPFDITVYDDEESIVEDTGAEEIAISKELPEISGYPTTQIKTNTKYSFIPTLSETKSNVTFSITNKPSWLTFDSTNGLLTGISPENSFTYKDITIHISNGANTTSLDPFDITVYDDEIVDSNDSLTKD
ncbi:MAG: Unknown protein [uncultured Sulfurovum sp.]|uniref:Dystroglycan-type cadherin-like domain-containing protein n=1 Tax=uncultured Sulfurovum sp. TaxID=269237 RepID=A0A6S6SY42_9BACT|nr:MAG: Unknown protein [uncultured Sulfurovum sp.]